MRAWQVRDWCEPEEMVLAEVPEPQPGPGQVAIRVAAAGLNFLDTLMIRGRYQVRPPLPFTPGVEVAGTVVAAGPGAALAPGEPVAAMLDWGGFAETAVAHERSAVRLPDGADPIEGVAIPIVYPTAHVALGLRARVERGECVLVHAGAGGVGLAAIQIAKAWGCRVIATAGSAEKLAVCRDNGADLALDYGDAGWVEAVKDFTSGRGADVVIDPVGGGVTDLSLKCIAWNGRLVVVGFAGGAIPAVAANRLLLKNVGVIGVNWGGYATRQPEVMRTTLNDVVAMWRRGVIRPVVSARYPLADAPRALADLAGRRTRGKVALVP
jgi:NADPH2:quinone reductase